jgi:hypothetical protein
MNARGIFSNCSARWALVAFLLIACAAARLNAQGYASISGTVSDPSGAVIPSATVTATQTQSGTVSVVKSGSDGNYVFPALLPSNYSISVSASGFKNYQQTGIVLQADQALNLSIHMQIGAATQTVSVSGDAPQVDVTTGTLSQVIDQASVQDIPLNGRAAASLITLVAGVVDATNEGNGLNQGNGKTFSVNAVQVASVNGTLPNQDNFLLDGGNNVDEMTNVNGPYPMPDTIQEFSVQTSNYNAEFGQSAGAMVNIVTKSGGEQFHGDLFEYLRNGFFNAESHFSPAGTQDTYHRHQFGGTVGGPVIVPHFSKGKSTQFFFGYQHTLIHTGSSSPTVTVPTLAEEGLTTGGGSLGYADYSNLCTGGWNGSNFCKTASQQIYNPITGTEYPNNHIPSADFDPASVAFEKAFPTASADAGAGKIGNLVNYLSATQNYLDEYNARVDHSFGANDHLFGHYFYDWFQQPAIYDAHNLQSYTSYFNTRYQNAVLAETHTFTTNLLNNLVLNYQREISLRGGPPNSGNITQFGVQNLWQPTTGPYMAASITGYFKVGSSAFAGWERNNYTLNDDLHWVKGAHNLAFGGHVELSKFDVTNVFTSYGGFTFAQAGSSFAIGNVNAMANFQTGFLQSFGQGNYEQVNDRNNFPGVYAQDSWKVNHRLTLNYGVRWEDFAPWANNISKQTAFSPTAYGANTGTSQYQIATSSAAAGLPAGQVKGLPAGMVLSGDPGFPKNGVNNKYTQFMPRVGFAYDLYGDGKTSLRGGFGMFYQDRMPGFFNLSQASDVPNTISVALTNLAGTAGNPGGPFSNPYCTGCANGSYGNPFPFTLPFKSGQAFPNAVFVGEYDPSGNFQVPLTNDYNLTIEQQLGSSWAMRLAYVGSHSTHQYVNLEINPAVNTGSIAGGKLTFPGGTSNANTRRVYNTAPTVGPCVTTTGCNTNYSQIVEAAMIGDAHFNSFQATIQRKMSHGLSLLANYTWSKSYDDLPQATRVSNTEDINAGESYVYPLYPSNATGVPAAAIVPDIKALDRGVSDIDHPQAFSVSYEWAPPKLNNGYGLLRAIVNDWRTSGIIQTHSGDALTAYMGSDNSSTGLSQDRAQRDFTQSAYLKNKRGGGDCPTTKICENWFSPSAFSVPANTGAGTGFGNVAKDSLRGPGFTVWNAAVVRTFPIFRETNMDFRAEYFDVLNHTILNNPSVSNPISSSTSFGTITSENGAGPRIAQFALKYTF